MLFCQAVITNGFYDCLKALIIKIYNSIAQAKRELGFDVGVTCQDYGNIVHNRLFIKLIFPFIISIILYML